LTISSEFFIRTLSRLLKKTICFVLGPSEILTYDQYTPVSSGPAASHLNLFEQPEKIFRNLIRARNRKRK